MKTFNIPFLNPGLLIAVMLISIFSSCSLIGYKIGSLKNGESQDQISIAALAVDSIKPGISLLVILVGGDSLQGNFVKVDTISLAVVVRNQSGTTRIDATTIRTIQSPVKKYGAVVGLMVGAAVDLMILGLIFVFSKTDRFQIGQLGGTPPNI